METPHTLHRTLRHYGTMVRSPKQVKNSQKFQNPIKMSRFQKYFGDLILTHQSLVFEKFNLSLSKIITKKFIFPCISPKLKLTDTVDQISQPKLNLHTYILLTLSISIP